MDHLRVAALVEPGSPGVKIITALAREDIPIAAVVIEVRRPAKPKPMTGAGQADRILSKTKTAWAGMAAKAADYGNEAAFWASQLAGLRPPAWLPPWTLKRRHFTADYYRRFSNRFLVVGNFNGRAAVDFLGEIGPDIIVLCGVNRIIKRQVIGIPRRGILNAHPGALPRYRGVDPVPHALLNGDRPELTVHLVDEGIDSGPVLETAPIPVGKKDSINDIWKTSEDTGASLMVKAVRSLMDGTASPRAQDNSVSCYNHRMSNAEKPKAAKRLKQMQRGMK